MKDDVVEQDFLKVEKQIQSEEQIKQSGTIGNVERKNTKENSL